MWVQPPFAAQMAEETLEIENEAEGATAAFTARWPMWREAFKKDMNLIFDEIDKKNWLGVGYLAEAHGIRTEKLSELINFVIEENYGLGAKTQDHGHNPGGYL